MEDLRKIEAQVNYQKYTARGSDSTVANHVDKNDGNVFNIGKASIW